LGVTVIVAIMVTAGLQARLLWQTTLGAILLGAIGLRLVAKPVSITEWLLHRLYQWGYYWLVLGLFLEPFEKGIKKDSSTLSYYFVTTGIAIFLLIALTIIIHVFSQKIWLQIFIDSGLNPMLAYIGIGNLLLPISSLLGWDSAVIAWAITPHRGLVKGFVYTLVLAGLVSLCNRLKLVLRT
jgi:predicted acyltransferase